MKKFLIKIKIWVLLIALFPTLTLAIGNDGAHGGDGYAAEFVGLANEIAQHLKKSEYEKLTYAVGLDVEAFKKSITTTLVYSAEANEVKVGEQIVDAVNYAGGPIKINRTNWRAASLIHKLTVVLHEYLGINKIELDTYEVSTRFNEAIRTLAARLLVQKSKLIRYYGTVVESPSLTAFYAMCSLDQDWLSEAKDLAASIAEERCKLERGVSCKAIAFLTRQIASSTMPGLVYCEITAVTSN